MGVTRGQVLLGIAAAVVTFALLGIGWRLFWQGPTECIELPASDCASVSAAARTTEWANNTSTLVIDPAPPEWADLGPMSAYPLYHRAEWRVMVGGSIYVACWREGGKITCDGPEDALDTL